jgi:GDPmannose 4,6-dehydratase
MPYALVIGVNGQDGSYLAEHLASQGWPVVGVGRQAQPAFPPGGNFKYVQTDLRAPAALDAVLTEYRPSRIYHLAAVHGASGFQYEDKFDAALAVNSGTVHSCLEHVRLRDPGARLLYASSLKVFGDATPPLVNEDLQRRSECLYSITKNAAVDLINYYRRHHNARASVLYLSNHESPRRPAQFFFPRVVEALAHALTKSRQMTQLKSLDFACDWGSAREFMEIGAQVLERPQNEDFLVATGRTWTGFEFVQTLFDNAGSDWQKSIAVESPPGSVAVPKYKLDISRLSAALGHPPRETAIDVARWMLREKHGIELSGR